MQCIQDDPKECHNDELNAGLYVHEPQNQLAASMRLVSRLLFEVPLKSNCCRILAPAACIRFKPGELYQTENVEGDHV